MSFHRLTMYSRMSNELDVEEYGGYQRGDPITIPGLQNPCRFLKAVYAQRPDGTHLKHLEVADSRGHVMKVRNTTRLPSNTQGEREGPHESEGRDSTWPLSGGGGPRWDRQSLP